MHPARLSEEELRAQVVLEGTRGSGPGGQHRNKAETGVRAIHRPTGIRVQAGERRSRHENERQALRRLRLELAVQHREALETGSLPPPGAYQPSELWRSRLADGRIVVSTSHQDFPALLAEALDVLAFCDDDVARAAGLLSSTTSQLVRFLAQEPRVLSELNQRRRRKGLKPYR